MVLGDTLRSLRTLNKMTQKELADRLSISPSTIGMYEQNRRMPDIDTLTKIAHVFNISVDYLLGIEKSGGNNYSNFQLFDESFDFKERVRSAMQDQGMSEDTFMMLTGFSKTEKDSYLYGNRKPSIEDLIKIAGALRVSTDYLLDMSQRKRISPEDELLLQTVTDRERNLIDTFRQLNMDNQDIIVGEAKKALKEQKYEESVAADPSLKRTGTDNMGK